MTVGTAKDRHSSVEKGSLSGVPRLKNLSLRATVLEVDQLLIASLQGWTTDGIVLGAVWELRECFKH